MNDFIVTLASITTEKKIFPFKITDEFFEVFTFSDIKHANISAIATLFKDHENISLNLMLKGEINQLPCDICTNELSVTISAETNLIIKKTDSPEDLISSDEILWIKKNASKIDLKHLIFELIILNIPKKRKHPLDKNGKSACDQEMIELINKYTQKENKSSDPRWDTLKSLK